MDSCHFLISSASVRSLPVLSFIMPILSGNVPLVSLIFLKRSLIFPILLFPLFLLLLISEGLLMSPRSSPELCIQLGTSFPFSLAFCFSSFSAISKDSSNNHFAFWHFFFFWMVLVTTSYTMVQTSAHNVSCTQCTRSSLLNLSITSNV